jgi:hypothetical protein
MPVAGGKAHSTGGNPEDQTASREQESQTRWGVRRGSSRRRMRSGWRPRRHLPRVGRASLRLGDRPAERLEEQLTGCVRARCWRGVEELPQAACQLVDDPDPLDHRSRHRIAVKNEFRLQEQAGNSRL